MFFISASKRRDLDVLDTSFLKWTIRSNLNHTKQEGSMEVIGVLRTFTESVNKIKNTNRDLERRKMHDRVIKGMCGTFFSLIQYYMDTF